MNNKANIDFNSIAGVSLALAAIMGGQLLEGGHLGALVQFAAFFIVVGGTVGAVLLQSPVKVLMNGVKMSKWIFFPPKRTSQVLIRQMVGWSYLA
ncbi:MAG TPA: flagellar motor protein, partial [Nitrosomonas sp.]|nr:flagellar motor protein [Nitrosomonas sp.]